MDRIAAFASLHRFHEGFDAVQEKLESYIGRPICMPGCGKCCEVNSPKCMALEAMNAVSILAGAGKASKIVDLAKGWLLEKHNEAPSYQGMIVGGFVPPEILVELTNLSRLPCPFLDVTKECLMHESRPLVCQAYGVTRTSEGGCNRAPGRGETITQFMYMRAPELQRDIRLFKEKYRKEHPEWSVYGFLPTLIYRAAEEKEFRTLVAENKIATAKLVGMKEDTALMWQPQVDAVRQGVSGDLLVT